MTPLLWVIAIVVALVFIGFSWLVIKSIFEGLIVVFKITLFLGLMYGAYYLINEISQSSHPIFNVPKAGPNHSGPKSPVQSVASDR